MKNIVWIRTRSIEDLAFFLKSFKCCPTAEPDCGDGEVIDCLTCWCKWLLKEREYGED